MQYKCAGCGATKEVEEGAPAPMCDACNAPMEKVEPAVGEAPAAPDMSAPTADEPAAPEAPAE